MELDSSKIIYFSGLNKGSFFPVIQYYEYFAEHMTDTNRLPGEEIYKGKPGK